MKRYKKSTPRLPHHMRAWREARGITPVEMSRRIGLSKASISRIENNLTPYYQDVIEAYAEVLECHPGDLIARPPTDPEGLWEAWDSLREPHQRVRAAKIIRALQETDENGDDNGGKSRVALG